MAGKAKRQDEQPELIGFSELIETPLVRLSMRASDRWEMLETLVDLPVSSRRVMREDRANILGALFDREGRRSNTVKNGVAMPCCAYDRALTPNGLAAPRALLVVGRCPEGVDFHARDGVPARLVFLFLLPRSKFLRYAEGIPHQALLFETGELIEPLMAARTPEEFIELIERAEAAEHVMHGLDTEDLTPEFFARKLNL